MDEQDREFEAFLRQFHLRSLGTFPAAAPVEVAVRWWRWLLAAASAAVVAVLALSLVRYFSNSVSPGVIVEAAGDSLYKGGETIAAGDDIHSGRIEPLLLRLQDGTRVEMRAQSQIVLESAKDGPAVHLNSGSILVRAVKQSDGHLYVNTKDTTVSVVGTLFLVEALPQGSRVAVLEGEVEVRLPANTHKLVTGQQVSSSSEIEFVSIGELTAWSHEVGPVRTLFVGELGGIRGSEGKRAAEATGQPVPASTRTASPQGQPPPQQTELPPQQPPPQQPQPAPSPEKQPSDAGADSPGKQVFYRACVACHSDEIAKARQWPSRQAVEDFIKFEMSRGASVSSQEVQPLADYIYTNYGAKPK
jgi:mono/diheme cytochrome c family protein